MSGPEPEPLTFLLSSLSIVVTADTISIDEYNDPLIKPGIYVKVNMNVEEARRLFVIITPDPSVLLRDSLTTVTYATLKKNIATSGTPVYSFDESIPYDEFRMGFAPLPTMPGFTMTKYTSSASTDKSVANNLLTYISKLILFSPADIATAEAAVDLKLPNNTYLYQETPGITNKGPFIQNFSNKLKNGFALNLNSQTLNSEGLGAQWTANPPSDSDGKETFYPATLEIVKKIFNNQEARLLEPSVPIAYSQDVGVKNGFTAIETPLKAGDKLQLNITVNISQAGFEGSVIPARVYRVEITLVE